MNFNKPVVLLFSLFIFSSSEASINDYFNQIKTDPNALYAFFKVMPKGGELHYHVAGGAYPETMLLVASKSNYCLDKNNYSAKSPRHCNGIKIKDLYSYPETYADVIRSWSFKDFIPGKETGHDHFFNGFGKYMPIIFDYRPQLIAEIIQRAAQQKEQYLELLDIPDDGNSIQFGELINNAKSYDKKKQILLNNKEFQNNINKTLFESDKILNQVYQELGCKNDSKSDPCKIKVKLLYYVLREQPLDNLFAQALNAFESVSRSKGSLVGVNLVQPEDGIISLRDYHKQMLVFNYLHKIYPKVNIALHAGELAPEGVTPNELSYHIHDALSTGHAQRIGHGVDIAYENNSEATLKFMAEHHLPVEINLTSNLKLLNISGRNHPLNYYLAHKVPVVLSTDDEGVLRTDLTRQYVDAVLSHGLEYQTLKQINRNTLTYAFLPGKSIWADAGKEELIQECQDLKSQSCQEFIKNNEKAKLQWDLEQNLMTFEGKY